MEKIHDVRKVLSCNSTKSLFVLFNATAESVNCFFFLKNLEKHLCNFAYKKNFAKHIENLLHIYRKNLSAIIYRLPISL